MAIDWDRGARVDLIGREGARVGRGQMLWNYIGIMIIISPGLIISK